MPSTKRPKVAGEVGAARTRLENGQEASELRVAIIGGGLGGLALCLALHRVGIAAKVYERDHHFDDRRQGYGLTLTNSPKSPLAQLGLLATCIEKDCASAWHWVFGPAGSVLGYYGRAFKAAAAGAGCGRGGGDSGALSQGRPQQKAGRREHRGNLRIPRQVGHPATALCRTLGLLCGLPRAQSHYFRNSPAPSSLGYRTMSCGAAPRADHSAPTRIPPFNRRPVLRSDALLVRCRTSVRCS